jgi:hypothetical protein
MSHPSFNSDLSGKLKSQAPRRHVGFPDPLNGEDLHLWCNAMSAAKERALSCPNDFRFYRFIRFSVMGNQKSQLGSRR